MVCQSSPITFSTEATGTVLPFFHALSKTSCWIIISKEVSRTETQFIGFCVDEVGANTDMANFSVTFISIILELLLLGLNVQQKKGLNT